MSWIKIDDQFTDHPKVLDVGPLAECLFVRGLTYASRYLTDGFVPSAHLRRMGDLDAIEQALRLVDAGLWDESDGGYQIHDYLDYQPSAEKVKAERESARLRMQQARSGKPQANTPNCSDEVHPNNDRSSDEVRVTPSRPVPSRINPEVPDGTSVSVREDGDGDAEAPPQTPEDPLGPRVRAVPKPRATRLSADFVVTDRMREQAIGYGLTPELIVYETDKFRDHFAGSGKVKTDWVATWRNWMREAVERLRARAPAGGKGARAGPSLARRELERLQGEQRGGP